MMVLISYDVMTTSSGGPKRLRRIAKECMNYGQRVQCSVFECNVDPTQWTVLRAKIIKNINQEKDSLRFYFLGANWRNRIEHIGAKETLDLEGPLVV